MSLLLTGPETKCRNVCCVWPFKYTANNDTKMVSKKLSGGGMRQSRGGSREVGTNSKPRPTGKAGKSFGKTAEKTHPMNNVVPSRGGRRL